MIMNVFDFDGTIYRGDSSRDFFFYCIKNQPKTRTKIIPIMWYGLGFVLKIVKKKKFKNHFFSIVSKIDNLESVVSGFWDANEKKIKKWYLEKKDPSDVVISASPVFLLGDICKRLNVNLISTIADDKTGLIQGENCHGKEKVRRFRERYPDGKIDEFYSDLYCDTPLAEMAEKAFIVKGEELKEWKFKK